MKLAVLREAAEGERLRQWGRKIAAKSGRAKAVVALARKLSGVLLAVDKSGQPFRMTGA